MAGIINKVNWYEPLHFPISLKKENHDIPGTTQNTLALILTSVLVWSPLGVAGHLLRLSQTNVGLP